MRLNPSPSARATSNASKPVRPHSDAWASSRPNVAHSERASPLTSINAPWRLGKRIVVTLPPLPHIANAPDKGPSCHVDDAYATTHEQRQRVSAPVAVNFHCSLRRNAAATMCLAEIPLASKSSTEVPDPGRPLTAR